MIIDTETVLDTKTGAELHMLDDYFKITQEGAPIVTMSDLTKEEAEIIWGIKQSITDPAILKQKADNYMDDLKARRVRLSDLYENPTPVVLKSPVEEEDTEEYQG